MRRQDVNQRRYRSGETGSKRTGPMTQILMERYSAKKRPVLKTKGQTVSGQVRMVPRLSIEDEQVYLEASVGAERLYVIRNMEEFCLHMHHGDQVKYGKQLTLVHKPEMFEKESRPLVEFIIDRFGEILTYRGGGNNYVRNPGFSKGKRGIRLSPGSVDAFFQLWMDQGVTIGFPQMFSDGSEYRCKVKAMNPQIPIKVNKMEQSFVFELPFVEFFEGANHLYIVGVGADEVFLWQCDKEFTDKMSDLLELAQRCRGYFDVNDEDMPGFCGNVISEIQDYCQFTGDVDAMEEYIPDEMSAHIYLDCPRPDTITARMVCQYGSFYLEPYLNQEVNEQGVLIPPEGGGRRANQLPVVRDEQKEYGMKLLLSGYFDAYGRNISALYFEGDNDRVYNFVHTGAAELALHAEVLVTDRFRRIAAAAPPKLTVGVSLESGLLKVKFDLEQFPVDELMEMLQQYRVRRKYHRLRNGSFLHLEDEGVSGVLNLMEGLRLTREDLEKGHVQLPQYRAMALNELLKGSEQIDYERSGAFKKLVREMKSVEDSDFTVPEELSGILRDYQKIGFRWLSTLAEYGFSGILADDMGLGKTLEMITFLLAAKEKRESLERLQSDQETSGVPGREISQMSGHEMANGSDSEPPQASAREISQMSAQEISQMSGHGTSNGSDRKTSQDVGREIPALVVCPASLVLNWEEELRKFCPELKALPVIGTAAERRIMIARAQQEKEIDLLITSYDLLKRDIDCYEELRFYCQIIDEAQYIKNHGTKNAKSVKRIQSQVRFALTGTPIENRLSELWSIFDYLMPGYLYAYEDFKHRYETAIVRDRDDQAAEMLEKQISPFVLRRLKRNVLQELPEKMESVVYTPMEAEQSKLYMGNLAKAKLEIGRGFTDGGMETNKIVILALLTRLRQICCHPALCYEDYLGESGKLATCMELVLEAVEGGHKILLFSQFTTMLELIRSQLSKEGIATFLLTGKTSKEDRRTMVERFNLQENSPKVFLISLKAGGTGLNLTAADVVIHYDPWWNLAAQTQATDRAHRIGQKNAVQVYKLIAKDTIEEKILNMQENKRALADAVIHENETPITQMSVEQLLELL